MNNKIIFLGFVSRELVEKEINKLKEKFNSYTFERNDQMVKNLGNKVFVRDNFEVLLDGTEFQKRVWRELRNIKDDELISYSQLAGRCNCADAVRAVASAVAKNNISVLIPCHRVVRKNGEIGKYRWGETTKKLLINGGV